MGRFIAERKGREFIVQPLPVQACAVQRVKKNEYKLSWQPTLDELEPSAKPRKYIVMQRIEGDLGFVKLGETTTTDYTIKINDTKIHSVYVIAANEGGVSFPSEILSFKEGKDGKTADKPVLIVNGFTRISGPANFSEGNRAGFKADEDFGVPYKYDISFSGYQREFNRNTGDRFGTSGSDYVSTVIAGNTFDYPALHGDAIAANTGRGFVSVSAKAVEEGRVKLSDYSVVDLILGKQKATIVGNGKSGVNFEAFPEALRKQISAYVAKGGKLIVSGQNIVSELYGYRANSDTRKFAEETLGITEGGSSNAYSGKAKVDELGYGLKGASLRYSNTLNKDNYIVEKVDVLVPAEKVKSKTFLTVDGNEAAGLLIQNGKARTALMTVPFETFLDAKQRRALMQGILDWMEK